MNHRFIAGGTAINTERYKDAIRLKYHEVWTTKNWGFLCDNVHEIICSNVSSIIVLWFAGTHRNLYLTSCNFCLLLQMKD
jgi:hypothetical protein